MGSWINRIRPDTTDVVSVEEVDTVGSMSPWDLACTRRRPTKIQGLRTRPEPLRQGSSVSTNDSV